MARQAAVQAGRAGGAPAAAGTGWARPVLAAIALGCGWLAASGGALAQSAVEDARLGTVRVAIIETRPDGRRMLVSSASAFAVAPATFVTNSHALPDPGAGPAEILVVGATAALGVHEARIVAQDERADLAVLAIDTPVFPPLTLSTQPVSAADDVFALGYPGVVDDVLGLSAESIITPARADARSGNVSNYLDQAPTGQRLATLTHSAQLSGGNSGGPLVDSCGRVIGVNTWTDQEIQTYGFAVSTSVLLGLLGRETIAVQVDNSRCQPGASPPSTTAAVPAAPKTEAPPSAGSAASDGPPPRAPQADAPAAQERRAASPGPIIAVTLLAILVLAAVIFLPGSGGSAPTGARGERDRPDRKPGARSGRLSRRHR
jgi:serine protease Do